MRSIRVNLLTGLLLLPCGAALLAAEAPANPGEVFAMLKSMEGVWDADVQQIEGEPEQGEAATEESHHEFSVSGAGSVVMEKMAAGTPSEMINMFHMDGDDLVLTHYCAAGNQPTMILDPDRLAEGEIHFAFSGGTNLDPAVDHHIHSATLEWDDDRLTANWSGWSGGVQVGLMQFVLSRR